MFQLRPATSDDAQLIYHIEEDAMRRYAEQTWGKWLPAEQPAQYIAAFDPTFQSIVLVEGQEAGVLQVIEHVSEVALQKLYLLSQYRCRGVGASVLAHVLSLAHSSGKPVRLHTLAVNSRARAFYERHGFIYDSGDDERVFYSKNDS